LGSDRRYDSPQIPQLATGIAHADVRRRLHLDLGLQEFLRDSSFRRAFCSLEESEWNIAGEELAPGIDQEIFLFKSKRESGRHPLALPSVLRASECGSADARTQRRRQCETHEINSESGKKPPAGLSKSHQNTQ